MNTKKIADLITALKNEFPGSSETIDVSVSTSKEDINSIFDLLNEGSPKEIKYREYVTLVYPDGRVHLSLKKVE